MKKTSQILIHLLLAAPLHSNELQPPNWMEQVEGQDSSIHECYVFRSSPGVKYRIETSNDLVDWIAQEEIYGLGHEHVVPIRQITSSNPPEPGPGGPVAPITPIRSISLKIQPATGGQGGTFVSWRSLDDGSPVNVILSQTMTPDWNQMPLFWERYGNHYFFIFRSPQPIPPPSSVTVLGPLDEEMYTQLQTSFPLMNQAIEDSVARSRNSPPSAPPDPSSRKFWRIFCDWSLDTDLDGSPDWVEFEIAARESGNPALRGDAFDGDTNRNGIADGKELDYDEDGIADANDIDLKDSSAAFPIGPVPRYAIFPISNAETALQAWIHPMQISDLGTVLYPNGTWTGGEWSPLAESGNGINLAYARSINDQNVILGSGNLSVPVEGGSRTLSNICYWTSPDAMPAGIATSDTYACASYDFAYNLLAPGPVLSNDGKLIQPAFKWSPPDSNFKYEHTAQWTLPTQSGTPATQEVVAEGLQYNQSPNLKWGKTQALESTGQLVSNEQIPNLPHVPRNVSILPSGEILALSDLPFQKGLVLREEAWSKDCGLYTHAIELSTDGRAIGHNHDGKVAPLLLNGKWMSIERYAPGPAQTWHDASVTHLDTSPSGWILARRGPLYGPTPLEFGVMLPLQAECQYVQEFTQGATTRIYTGVDDFSTGAIFTTPAVGDKIWIMVPKGGSPKSVIFESPLDQVHPLKLSADDVDFGNIDDQGILHSKTSTTTIKAKDGADTGSEPPVEIKFGETISKSTPLGVKVMKSRTVRVTIYKVTKQTPGKPNNTADQVPEPETITKYLNDIFSPQINVRFVVTEAPDPLVLNWDVNLLEGDPNTGNDILNCNSSIPSHEQTNILNSRPAERPGSDIDLFFIGSEKYIDGKDWASTLRIPGQSSINACWIVGDPLADRTLAKLYQTVAHEIGHILVGYGHPDAIRAEMRGPAELPGTNHAARLMCGGNAASALRGHMLVKEEWDQAEAWLKPNIDDKEPE